MWVELLKDKNAISVLNAFKKIFKTNDRKPQQLQTDDGKEFVNKTLKNYLESNEINYFTISSDTKACIAERVIRTLKEKIYRYFTQNNTYRYVDILQDLVNNYNGT